MKKEFVFLGLIIFLGLFLSLNFVSAVEFQKSSENSAIIPEFNHSANFELIITEAKSGDYHFYTFADVDILPAGNFKLSSGENNLELEIYAQERLKKHLGFYTFVYNLKGDSYNSDDEDRLTIKVVPLKDAIEISSDTISPETDEITFYVKNKEKAKVENVTARFISVFFNYEITFNLNPLEKTEITIPINQEDSKKIKAGIYIVNAEFETDEGKKVVEGKLYWGEKKGIVSKDSSSGFFIRTQTTSKINIGNVPQEVEINVRRNIFSRLFTSFNIQPTLKKRVGFGVEYSWIKELGAAESLEIKTRTNYIMPFILIILLGIIVYSYVKYNTKKIEVIKSVSHIKTKGGEFALKVRVLVKAKKSIENVSLVDRIPALAKVHEKLWTVAPKKIDTINRRIYWDLGDMSLGEERVFSYVIYSKVGVIGKFTLPEAIVILERNGKIQEVSSNKVFFLSEQIKRD